MIEVSYDVLQNMDGKRMLEFLELSGLLNISHTTDGVIITRKGGLDERYSK